MQSAKGFSVGHGWNKVVWGLLGIFLVLNLVASICFKEGGTNPALRWLFFIIGNTLGITNTWFVMRLYQRVNANMAIVLTSGPSFVTAQLVYWRLYHSPLNLLQWGGIGIVLVGTMMVARSPGLASAKQAVVSSPAGEGDA